MTQAAVVSVHSRSDSIFGGCISGTSDELYRGQTFSEDVA